MSQYSQNIFLLSLHFSYLHSRRLREHSGCIVLKVNVLRHVIHSLDIWAYKLSLAFLFIQKSIELVRGDNGTPIGHWILDEHLFLIRGVCPCLSFLSKPCDDCVCLFVQDSMSTRISCSRIVGYESESDTAGNRSNQHSKYLRTCIFSQRKYHASQEAVCVTF